MIFKFARAEPCEELDINAILEFILHRGRKDFSVVCQMFVLLACLWTALMDG